MFGRKPQDHRRNQGAKARPAALLGLAFWGLTAAVAPALGAPMPLGPRTAPPAAFIDFCRRQPGDCGADAQVMRERLQAADASPWAMRFAASRGQAPGAFQSRRAYATEIIRGRVYEPEATSDIWDLAERINARVNNAIIRRSDWSTYHVEDRWATPLARGYRFGDCEDYALEKRRLLIAAGVPAQALNIALATTRRGESHAVLLLAAGGTEYVLDNLEPWILPWDQAPYRWRARQVGGDPFQWAYAAAD
jgi:predicted transglutaminase-like cysteine proteinase